jgi:hypothetical protein
MGSSRTRSTTPDLFSTASATMPLSPSQNSPPSSAATDDGGAAASPSYALPTNLPSALRHLDDDQLDRLFAAVIGELKQRGKKLPKSDVPSRKQRPKEVDAPPLAQGKLNAIRAAFKAGVRPSRIAREFGVSHADVRKVLTSDEKK